MGVRGALGAGLACTCSWAGGGTGVGAGLLEGGDGCSWAGTRALKTGWVEGGDGCSWPVGGRGSLGAIWKGAGWRKG